MLTLVLSVTLRKIKQKHEALNTELGLLLTLLGSERLQAYYEDQTHRYIAGNIFPVIGSHFLNQRFELVVL